MEQSESICNGTWFLNNTFINEECIKIWYEYQIPCASPMALWTTSLNAVTSFSQQLVCVSHLYAFKRHWNAYENRKNNIQNNKMNSHFKLLSGSHMEPIPKWKPAFVLWGISVITIKEGVGCTSNSNKQLWEPRMLSGQLPLPESGQREGQSTDFLQPPSWEMQ